MSIHDPRRVASFRLSDEDFAMLDDLVAAAPPVSNWWEPGASRSSVIRVAIAKFHTELPARQRLAGRPVEVPGQVSLEDS
jgi:hypothetical protein